MPLVLAYWKIRGLAQPPRLLLNYAGAEFEDKLYECGPAPDFDVSSWTKQKYTLGLDFPNLPYLIDGNVKLTQSNAIMRYLGRKYKLCGTTDTENNRVDLMTDESMDLRNGWVRLCYNPKFSELKEGYAETLNKKLDAFETFLGDNQWFAGKTLTYVDFIMYELLDQHQTLFTEIFNTRPKLQGFMNRFKALPAIKSYMESDKFMKAPLNNKMAAYIGE